jgi:flavorubredoxin
MSPVKEKRIPYMESSEKTKSKCVTKALQCISAICETICPGEGQVLQENVKTLIAKEVRETEKVI